MTNRRPAHILLANSVRLWAGAERFVVDAAAGLADRGRRVTIQAYPGAPLAQRARSAGIEVHEVMTRADGAPWTVAPLMRWMQRERVDVVLSNYEKDLRTAGWAARLCNRPIAVVHSRECDVPLKDRPHYRYFYNRVAHHVLANSEATRVSTLASANWLAPSRVTVLPKGVDLKAYALADGLALRQSWGVGCDETLLGFAGQLVPRKRCGELIAALAGDAMRMRPWRLVLAGAGEERSALCDLARGLGLEDRVIFAGFVEDMPGFMHAIDLLVLPSLVEGFGYVLAEAAAAGTPCVAYRSSSAPELVLHGETGLLADPDVDDALEAALMRLVDDPGLRARMGLAALDHARRNLGLPKMVDALERLLERVYDSMMRREEEPVDAARTRKAEEVKGRA